MALSKEVADELFRSLKLVVSTWFDRRKYGVSMLKVLYRDHIKDTLALHECSKMMEIIKLLIGTGHLTPDNLTLIYETINVTQQFGLEKKIKDQYPDLIQKDIKNIVIMEFTRHRQKLVNLGMALTADEIQDIGELYNVGEEHTTDSWSLIKDLEQRMIICEEKMEAFIKNLKKHYLLRAVKALTEDKKQVAIDEPTMKAAPLDSPKMLMASDKMKCVCGNERQVKCYCQECRLYLCSTCRDHHKILPVLEKHKLHSIMSLQKTASLDCCDIGIQVRRITDCLKLMRWEPVTQGQLIIAKVIQTEECDIQINANQLKATWTDPTGKTNITQVVEDNNGEYFVTGKCESLGLCILDVSVDGESIKQSPMMIKVEKRGSVKSIPLHTIGMHNIRNIGLVKCEDCLLVSTCTNEIHKYNFELTNYIGKITLHQDVKVTRMYKMQNGNIAFIDKGNRCIGICNINDQIGTIGQGLLKDPRGLYVNETANVFYVADSIHHWFSTSGCVCIFENGQSTKTFGEEVLKGPVGIKVNETSNVVYVADSSSFLYMFNIIYGNMFQKISLEGGVYDIAFTNKGNLFAFGHSEIKLFNNEGSFIKDIKVKYYPLSIVVDKDDIIVLGASGTHLIILSSNGNHKTITFENKYLSGNIPQALPLCIISHHPRRIALCVPSFRVAGSVPSVKIINC